MGILGPTAVQPMTVEKIPSIIEITPATVTLSSLGESLEFSAEVRDGSGELLNSIPLDWSSSLPEVATINDYGRVTAIDNGVAIISAAAGET